MVAGAAMLAVGIGVVAPTARSRVSHHPVLLAFFVCLVFIVSTFTRECKGLPDILTIYGLFDATMM
jgi:hypothetical protein